MAHSAIRMGEDTTRIEEMPTVTIAARSDGVFLFVKRTFDVVMALMACLVVAIPCAVIYVVIRLDSPGPGFYRQERVGKGGKSFVMYKFRTMRLDAEKNGPQWADKHDSRCTKVGTFLRNSRLDELPQLLNILRGDMSFVGPRPERQVFYEIFETYIPRFYQRLAVTPGLTGLAQVNGGYDLGPEEKLCYDMEYIRNQSVGLDLQCLFSTIHIIFDHEGAR